MAAGYELSDSGEALVYKSWNYDRRPSQTSCCYQEAVRDTKVSDQSQLLCNTIMHGRNSRSVILKKNVT